MHFVERQRFSKWLWALMVPLMLGSAGMMWYGVYHQLVLKRPWGDRPTSDAVLVGTTTGVTLLTLGILWLIVRSELLVEVRPDTLYIRFFPFLTRRIAYSDICRAEARQYSPIGEYGGWGVRVGTKGKAYNASGNRGVQLELANGERLLIGSQRPEELAGAIRTRISA